MRFERVGRPTPRNGMKIMKKVIARLASIAALLAVIAPPGAGAATTGAVDIGSAMDAHVVEGYSTSNYGSASSIYVQSASGGSYKDERAWTMFNLKGSLPPGATIVSARLRLYCWKADDADDLSASVYGSDDDSWTESGLTWSGQPAYGSTALSSVKLVANDEDKWIEWDVTAFVQAQYAGDGKVSLVVKPAVEGQSSYAAYVFDAKEYSTSLAPRLRIEYTGEWPTDGAFKIFHVNDTHSRLLPHEFDFPDQGDYPVFEKAGGAAYLAAEMLALKQANPESLILDAGDISEGSPLGDLRGNGGNIDFFKLLDAKLKALGGRGIDATVVGNHDVRSLTMLTNLKNVSEFPVLSVNVCYKGTQTPYFSPYAIVTVNGKKVGIIGYTHDESAYMSDETAALIDVVPCVWDDNDSSTINIKDKVKELRETEGCDLVVLLAHIGHSRIVSGSDALIADVGGVIPPEVVIAGHWHTWTQTAWQPSNLDGKTLVDEAASYMQYIGELEVTGAGKYVQAQKHAIRTSEITPDVDVLNLISTLTAEYNSGNPPHALDEIIGYTAQDLTMDKDKWWTVSEYPWNATNSAGAWVCDAMIWKAEQLGHPCALALQSGGSIRRDIPAGPITYTALYETYPWEDNAMVTVAMTGREIWDVLQAEYCGASISKDWEVYAEDGIIKEIKHQGEDLDLSATYTVILSDYMAAHEDWAQGKTATDLGCPLREAVVDYTSRFTESNPMVLSGPRYQLDTELAGGFKAVITMIADSESQPYFEDAFVRLIEATPATVERRYGYGLSDLVKADGSINGSHQFSETMLYRSCLGFPDGKLKPGDVIEIWGEGGFYDGNPQLVDQEGIYGPETEFHVLGHDESLAQPEYYAAISGFWDEWHENHFVKFYATKTGVNTIKDFEGAEVTVYQPGGYYTKMLPGSVGDILELTGANTYDVDARIFRCYSAKVASENGVVGAPPSSSVDAIAGYKQTSSPLVLTAAAGDPAVASSATVAASADAQVVEGYPTSNYGSSTSLYVQSYASGSYTNERAWVKFDLSGVASQGAVVASAKLKLYCWKATGGGMNASAYGHTGSDDWTETGITWNSQPTYGSALDTVTIASGATYAWYSWDVTSFVQNELDSGDNVVSLLVKAATEGSSTALTYAFDSKEYSSGTYAPVLEIEFQSGEAGDVATVQFMSRYSQDGLTWTAWNPVATDSASPWSANFDYPEGYGYYEFYSVATDGDGNVETAPVTADAKAFYVDGVNDAPGAASDPSISDGQIDVESNTRLSVTVSDPDFDVVDVYFYAVTDSGVELLGVVKGVASGQKATIFWLGLEEGKRYQWYTVVSDGTTTTQSPTWSFSTVGYEEPVANEAPALSPWAFSLLLVLLAGVGMHAARGGR